MTRIGRGTNNASKAGRVSVTFLKHNMALSKVGLCHTTSFFSNSMSIENGSKFGSKNFFAKNIVWG